MHLVLGSCVLIVWETLDQVEIPPLPPPTTQSVTEVPAGKAPES